MLTGELRAKLIAASLTTGYDVLEGKMPHTPNKVIALTESGGTGPEKFLGGGTVEQPAVQVRVRGEADDYAGPRLTIERIYQTLDGYGAFTVSGTRYLTLTPLQSPFLLRRDDNARCEFAVNFLVEKELSTA